MRARARAPRSGWRETPLALTPPISSVMHVSQVQHSLAVSWGDCRGTRVASCERRGKTGAGGTRALVYCFGGGVSAGRQGLHFVCVLANGGRRRVWKLGGGLLRFLACGCYVVVGGGVKPSAAQAPYTLGFWSGAMSSLASPGRRSQSAREIERGSQRRRVRHDWASADRVAW